MHDINKREDGIFGILPRVPSQESQSSRGTESLAV